MKDKSTRQEKDSVSVKANSANKTPTRADAKDAKSKLNNSSPKKKGNTTVIKQEESPSKKEMKGGRGVKDGGEVVNVEDKTTVGCSSGSNSA